MLLVLAANPGIALPDGKMLRQLIDKHGKVIPSKHTYVWAPQERPAPSSDASDRPPDSSLSHCLLSKLRRGFVRCLRQTLYPFPQEKFELKMRV